MFAQFIKERQYLANVSPATLRWYAESFKWLGSPDADLKEFVIRMREKGLKATSCNNRIRAVNAYLKWAGRGVVIPKLKEPQKILPTFTPADIHRFMQYKPPTITKYRLKVLLLTFLDTGCRANEALSLRWEDVDMDNLLLTLNGKGAKQRKIPFSMDLRKLLFRLPNNGSGYVFATRTHHNKLGRNVVLRDVKLLCKSLGIRIPERTLHACRHTFATNWIRRGGSVATLQRILGHSSIVMTMRYVNLQTSDLQNVHQKLSMLNGH
jgi:integrase/recombinase XerD